MKIIGIIAGLVLFLTPASHDSKLKEQETTYLQRGLAEKKAGNYKAALEIWEEARTVLVNPSLLIAREHIQLVTEQDISASYQIASAMYFWGLAASEVDKSTLEEEMKMLEPIVEPATYKKWRKAFKEQPEMVPPLIQEFWIYQDFTPDTPYNERLLEHWERIAYARKNFRKRSNTIYGTDDRGIGWVKFGEPNLIHKADFTLFPEDIYSMIFRKTGSHYVSRQLSSEVFNINKSVREYEIWVYTTHNTGPMYNNVLIYGDTVVKGFAQATTINDFIPNGAFSLSARFAGGAIQFTQVNPGGGADPIPQFVDLDTPITPAVLMQIELLEQVAGIDPQFGQAYDRITHDFFQEGPLAVTEKRQALTFKTNHIQTAIKVRNSAPKEASTHEEAFPSIPLQVYQYRFLDDENKPFSIAYVESMPQGVFIQDSARNLEAMEADEKQESVLTNYKFEHGLQIRDTNQRLLASQKLYPHIDINIETISPPSISIFQVPYVSPDTWQVFYTQLKNNHPKTKPEIESPFPNELRGIGTIKQQQGESLNSNPEILEISDIILGYDLDQDNDGTTFIPFEASHNKEIPQGEDLVVHYELYHLKRNQGGISRFEIDVEVVERRKGLNRLKNVAPDYTLTLNQQIDNSLFRENLEIKTSDLDKGTYVLKMVFKDTISLQKLEKKITFSIIE